ncbi:MAG: HAD-IIIA family hydrolase [Cyclobacteriaceae bacterium]
MASGYKNKAIFLDRDGVLNRERGEYTYLTADFDILPGVPEALGKLKSHGYYLIVITNQAGIAKGLYTKDQVLQCHKVLQEACGYCLDHLYYAPWHPSVSESLSRKPGSLMFERAIARYSISPSVSYMVGDKERDLIPAASLGIRTVSVSAAVEADIQVGSLGGLLSYLK